MISVRSLLKKLNSLSPAARASFWFVVSNVVLKGIGFITTPIFTRLLGPGDYGITSVFVSWEGVISVFATLSLAGGVYNIAQTKYEDDIDGYTSSMLSLTFIASLVVYSVCIGINVLFPSVFQLNTAYLLYMWIQTFTNAAITFWLMRKRFVYDYKSVIFYTVCNAVLSPAIAIVAILLFPENPAYAKIIGAGIPGIAIGIYLVVSTFYKGRRVYDGAYWKYALKFNIPLLPHLLAGTLLSSSDKLMINAMVSSASAGIYSIAHSITGLIGIVTQSINYSLIPYTVKAVKSGDYRGLRRVINSCILLVGAVCLCVMMFAKEGVMIFATVEFIDAVWFVAPLSLSVIFSFLYGIIGNIMYYYEKTGVMSVITITIALTNLTLNYFGIILFGPIAAGYTTLICSILQALIYYFVVKKYEKNLNKIIDLKFLLIVALAYTCAMIYTMVFYNNLFARIGFVFLIMIFIFILGKKIVTILKT